MTDVKLVKDCGLYPSYKKIIDFTGTKSQIISKQISWINGFTHRDELDVNYNKFQNKLVMPIDYEEALTYTYCVLSNITGTDDKPQFFFVNDVENLTNGIDNAEPNVAFYLSLDPIMTYMGEYEIDNSMVIREHVNRWDSSSKPIRVTPNIEKSGGFEVYKTHRILTESPRVGYNFMLLVITIVQPDGQIKEYMMPICLEHGIRFKISAGINPESDPEISGYWATLQDVKSGRILDWFQFQPDSVAGVNVYPLFSVPISYDNSYTEPFVAIGDSNVHSNGVYESRMRSFLKIYNNIACLYDGTLDSLQDTVKTKTVSLGTYYPLKPVYNTTAFNRYEPSIMISPYRRFTINDGLVDLFDIPDNIILESEGTLSFKIKTQLSASQGGSILYVGNDVEEALGNNCITFIPSIPLEIGNDNWLQYSISAKDADRQIVTNYAIKNAIDNLIYMSYGGALVGSRSMGKEGLWNPGKTTPAHLETRSNPRKGTSWKVRIPEVTEPGSLTDAGRRVVGATALAAGASVVTSLVDGAVAWANQIQQENKIKNTASGMLQGGASISRIKSGCASIKLIIRGLDDINYNKNYIDYQKFGNIVYKFEKPDTQSRLYYNYVMTDSSIINGAINQSIRDTIASIFDAGVTIFHYDSGDTTTRNLEYTDKENIEVSLL